MQRAASLTTTAGGYAVPVELDTTLILTSPGSSTRSAGSPASAPRTRTRSSSCQHDRHHGRLRQRGDGGIRQRSDARTADRNVEKAFAFVPMSIEIFEDWAGIREDMAMAFQDAKDTLENTKFLTGLGHALAEPQGLIAVGGATASSPRRRRRRSRLLTCTRSRSAVAAVQAQRASIVGNRAAFQKVRQFDTAGGANLWVQLQNDNPPELIGYPAYEWSAYSSAVTTSASTVLTIGDFN
jgi:hypothetical protein